MIIAAQNLHKTYPNGTRALRGINLTVQAGEMIGVLGSSGAGKTTFMRLLNGSLRPSAGQLDVLGHSLHQPTSPGQLRKLRREVGTVYQNHNVIAPLSVLQNVLMGRLGRERLWDSLGRYFYTSKARLDEAQAALAAVGLSQKLYTRTEDLSGGQQQRVAVARVLVQQPRLLLADEPIASVDMRTAGTLLDIFSRLNSELGTTVIMNLHQVDFALHYCRRILVFENGSLKYDGDPQQLDRQDLYGAEAVGPTVETKHA